MTHSPSPHDELKPCPFCKHITALKITAASELLGEDDEPYMHTETWAVICDASKPNGPGGCGGQGGFALSEAEAVEKWNRRVDAAQSVPAVEPTADIPALMLQIRDAAACRYAAGLSDGSRDAGASSFSEADAEELFTKIEAALTRLAATAAPVAVQGVPEGLIAALKHQWQIDEDGTGIGVNREALYVAIEILEKLAASPAAQPVPAHVELTTGEKK